MPTRKNKDFGRLLEPGCLHRAHALLEATRQRSLVRAQYHPAIHNKSCPELGPWWGCWTMRGLDACLRYRRAGVWKPRATRQRVDRTLPQAPVVSHDEVLTFLNAHRLTGRGLGWVDLHLLASAKLGRLPFWTLDKPLAAVAATLQLQS